MSELEYATLLTVLLLAGVLTYRLGFSRPVALGVLFVVALLAAGELRNT
jgi:hypothetical protein